MSGIPSLTILPEEQKFNGENLLQWKINITQLLASKGLIGYINGKVPKPGPESIPLPADSPTGTPIAQPATSSTPIYSSTPTLDEWIFRDQLARGHITLNCKDVMSLGVMTGGTAREAWDSIQAEWGKSTDMRRSHAQEALNRTLYVEGCDVQEHIKLLRIRKAAVDNLATTPMDDETWRGVIIRSIPPTMKWLPVIPSLYAMSSSADIISTLSAHGMILGQGSGQRVTSSSSTALAARATEGCINPNCKAKKRTTHTTADCYWPGGGKEGQFPPNFGKRTKANVVTSTAGQTTTPNTGTPSQSTVEHFALSVQVPNTPGHSGVLIEDDPATIYIPATPERTGILIEDDTHHPHSALISNGFQKFGNGKVPTFMDSAASDTMFVSRDKFSSYTPVSRVGDSAKATGGDFEIVGEGTVVQRYRVEGKEREITYTRALHTPALNANLVSVSALDRAGLTTTFGQGQGIAKKADGTIVLSGKGVAGMYLLEPLDVLSNVPTAMASLSKPTLLEQWHRRLTHCSPLTIKEMAAKNLVDGLVISGDETHGKCEDCILGRQTRRPFDGETDKDLLPLDLVSFDLWGPSRVQSIGGKIYLMIIVDGGTSYKFGAYLSDKLDTTTLAVFEAFRTRSETVTGRKVRRLRTDGAFDTGA
jgi:hypothetical protein